MKKLFSILLIASLLPGFVRAQLEGRAFKADGVPTTGSLKVHCFYVETIPSKKTRKDKVYGELKGAPTTVNHQLDGTTVTIYKGDNIVKTGTADVQGYFQWTDVPAGTYKVVTSKPPYKDCTITKDLIVGQMNEVECNMTQDASGNQ